MLGCVLEGIGIGHCLGTSSPPILTDANRHSAYPPSNPYNLTSIRSLALLNKHKSTNMSDKSEIQAKAYKEVEQSTGSDNIAHALAGAGGGLLSMALTFVNPSATSNDSR